jgi:hypothetical protein
MFLQPHTDWQFSFTSFICLYVQQKIDNLFLPVMPAFGKKAFQVYTDSIQNSNWFMQTKGGLA